MNVVVAIVVTALTFILMKLRVLRYSGKTLIYVAMACLILVPVFLTIPMNYFSPGGELRVIRNTIQVVPRVPGTITQVFVKSGDKVRSGDPLFAIDPRTFEDQVRQLESSLADAKTRDKLLDEQVKSAEAGLEAARQQLTLAEAQYTSSPLEAIRAAEAEVQKAKANEFIAAKELERQQDLFNKQLIAAEEFDRQRQSKAIADNDYRVAVTRFEQARITMSSGNQQIASAQQQVNQAESALRQAQLNSSSTYDGLNPLIAQTESQLRTARLNLDWTTITASIDGTVLNVQLRPGIQVGAAPVLVLQDDTSTQFIVTLKQSTLRHVKIGHSAEMFFDLHPGKHFTGKVKDIGRAVQEGQITATANLMSSSDVGKRSPFTVELVPDDPTLSAALPTGAGGFGTIFTDRYEATQIPRKLLARMASWWKLVMP